MASHPHCRGAEGMPWSSSADRDALLLPFSLIIRPLHFDQPKCWTKKGKFNGEDGTLSPVAGESTPLAALVDSSPRTCNQPVGSRGQMNSSRKRDDERLVVVSEESAGGQHTAAGHRRKRVQPAATPPAPFNLLQGQTVSQTGENVPVIKRYVSPRRRCSPCWPGLTDTPRL